jgi:hypothetical protein
VRAQTAARPQPGAEGMYRPGLADLATLAGNDLDALLAPAA